VTDPTPAIQARGLRKRFGEVQVVSGVDLEVHDGELFGFLGPNGAGKTTTVRMLIGVLEPTGGVACIKGHDTCTEGLLARAHLGVVPEDANVYLDLTVWQNIMLMAELHGVPRRRRTRRAVRLLDQFGLAERKGDRARTLSKGLRQRLMLCAALVTRPEILFLDEPTSGLDVQSARLIRQIIRELNGEGQTVFLTTHDMSEAERMCSRLAIIDAGRVVAIDTPGRLRAAMRSSQYVEVRFSGPSPDPAELEALPGVSRVLGAEDGIRLFGETPGPVATEVARFARARDLEIDRLCTCKPSLEDVFVQLTGARTDERQA